MLVQWIQQNDLNTFVAVVGIPSAEAFGAAQVNQTLYGTGIASAEAFGTAKVQLDVAPTGIASGQALGTPAIQLVLKPTGIASSAAFGTATIDLRVTPTGIASGEAIGSAKVQLDLGVTGIPSGQAFGTAKSQLDVSPTGIASGQAFGAASVQLDVAPTGISSSAAFGAPAIQLDLKPSGIASGEAFGNATVSTSSSTQTISPVGIPSRAAFGQALVISLSPPASASTGAPGIYSSAVAGGGGGGGAAVAVDDSAFGDEAVEQPAPPAERTPSSRFPVEDVVVDILLGPGAISRGASQRVTSFATGKLGKGAGAVTAVSSPIVTHLATRGKVGSGALVAGAALGALESLWKTFVEDGSGEKAVAGKVRYVTAKEFAAKVHELGVTTYRSERRARARRKVTWEAFDVIVTTYGAQVGDEIWVCERVRRAG